MPDLKKTTEYFLRLARGVFITIAVLCCCGAAASFLARFHLIFELSCHFYIQYFAFTSIAALIFTYGREWKKASAMAVFAIYCGAALAPFMPYKAPVTTAAAGAKTFRAVCANVHTASRAHFKVIDMVREYNPDFLIVIEVNKLWLEALRPLEAGYPHTVFEPSEDNFGMAFYSRIKPVTAEIIFAGSLPVAFLKAKFSSGAKTFALFGAHPLPPLSPDYFKYRNDQLEDMASITAREGGPAVFMGDLNATPWSPYFKDFTAAAGLKNSAEGFGLFPSWPSHMPLLRIPIDHCLNSAGVIITNVFKGSFIGSDHFPIIVDFMVE